MTKQMILVDVELTIGLAVDNTMTPEEVIRWVSQAIEAKLDAEAEMEDWGGGRARVFYNGEEPRLS